MQAPSMTKVDPSGYLDLAVDCLKHIQILISLENANPVPINYLQCSYLFEKLCGTLKHARASWSFFARHQKVTKHFEKACTNS
jgi:hypothetical protein